MHDDYKSALKKVHEVWLDVESWWQSKEIQELRDEFCYRYAWSSKTWRRDWLKFLWNL
jgi:putative transferase (TIGR04331 family)